jgi:hypothetical protein
MASLFHAIVGKIGVRIAGQAGPGSSGEGEQFVGGIVVDIPFVSPRPEGFEPSAAITLQSD